MPPFLCTTCATQFADSPTEPARCPICEDSRQYVGWNGQQWTTLQRLRETHHADIRPEAEQVTGLGVTPGFAIGQRALLVATGAGNLLWDCIPLLDDELMAAVQARGGIDAIAISHPHYYSSMVEWAHAFDAPVYLHEADREWVMRPDPSLQFWSGDRLELDLGVQLLRLGGHFEGGAVAHWPGGADGRGALLAGDIVQVVSDRRWVSFMRSYPNLVPLPADAVAGIAQRLEPYPFEVIYGAWYGRVVAGDGHRVVQRSAQRYCDALAGRFD